MQPGSPRIDGKCTFGQRFAAAIPLCKTLSVRIRRMACGKILSKLHLSLYQKRNDAIKICAYVLLNMVCFKPLNVVWADIETQPESFESYQLRILRNQNYMQAEKIKALREDLLEANQKMYELKPHLFVQSDPADQTKIAELVRLLEEKEKSFEDLTVIKDALDEDLAIAKKRVNDMETVKEALAAMIGLQKTAQEERQANFQEQFDNFQVASEKDKAVLLKKIQRHEEFHEKLAGQLVEKKQTIHRLDQVAMKLDRSLTTKEKQLQEFKQYIISLYDEMLLLSVSHSVSKDHLKEQLVSLITALEWEKTENQQMENLAKEWLWASDILHTNHLLLSEQIEYLDVLLGAEQERNREFNQIKASLELHKGELSLLNHMHDTHREEMNGYLYNLATTVEAAHMVNQQLHDKLLNLTSAHETSLEHIEGLKTQLIAMQEGLSSQDIKNDYVHREGDKKVGTLLSHLEQAETNSEDFQTFNNELSSKLGRSVDKQIHYEEILSFAHGQDLLTERILHLKADLQNEKDRFLHLGVVLEDTIASSEDLQSDVRLLHHAVMVKDNEFRSLQDLSAEQILHLKSDLQTEENRVLHLEGVLEDTIAASEGLLSTIHLLHHAIGEKDNEFQALQDLSAEQILHLKSDLQTEENRALHLEGVLEDTIASSKDLLSNVRLLHHAIGEKDSEFQALQDLSAEQILHLKSDLQTEENRALHLEGVLEDTIASSEGLLSNVRLLHHAIGEKDSEFQALQDLSAEQILHLKSDLQTEENRALHLEGVLEDTIASSEGLLSNVRLLHHAIGEKDNEFKSLQEKHDAALALHKENLENEEELHLNLNLELLDQIKNLTQDLENERAKHQATSADLNFARSNYTRERGHLSNLEKIWENTSTKLAQAEALNEQYELSINQKDYQIQNLMEAKKQLKANLAENYENQIQELQIQLEGRELQNQLQGRELQTQLEEKEKTEEANF